MLIVFRKSKNRKNYYMYISLQKFVQILYTLRFAYKLIYNSTGLSKCNFCIQRGREIHNGFPGLGAYGGNQANI